MTREDGGNEEPRKDRRKGRKGQMNHGGQHAHTRTSLFPPFTMEQSGCLVRIYCKFFFVFIYFQSFPKRPWFFHNFERFTR